MALVETNQEEGKEIHLSDREKAQSEIKNLLYLTDEEFHKLDRSEGSGDYYWHDYVNPHHEVSDEELDAEVEKYGVNLSISDEEYLELAREVISVREDLFNKEFRTGDERQKKMVLLAVKRNELGRERYWKLREQRDAIEKFMEGNEDSDVLSLIRTYLDELKERVDKEQSGAWEKLELANKHVTAAIALAEKLQKDEDWLVLVTNHNIKDLLSPDSRTIERLKNKLSDAESNLGSWDNVDRYIGGKLDG